MYSKMKCMCFCFLGIRQYSRWGMYSKMNCVWVGIKTKAAYVLAEKGGDMSNLSGTQGTVVTMG